MDRSLARRILLAALAIGVLADIALDGPAFGLNLPVLTAATLVAAWLLRRPGRAPDPLDAWLPVSALVLAAFVAVRADPFVTFLDIAGAAVFMGASVAAFSGLAVTRRSATVVMATAAWVLEAVVAGAGRALRAGRPAASDGPRHAPAWFGPVGRGLILAVPLVLIFAVLFASADPIFNRGFQDVMHFRIDLGDLPGRVIFVLAIAWLAGGLLTVAAHGLPALERASLGAAAHSASVIPERLLGTTEALVVLVAIDLIVGLFVGLQLAYLFGGLDTLAAAGMKYSDYARRGYFELVAAAALAGGILVALEYQVTRRSRLYVALAIGLVGLTIVVLASAALRLQLYQDAYGWTELRLYVAVSIAAMAVTLAVLAAFLAIGSDALARARDGGDRARLAHRPQPARAGGVRGGAQSRAGHRPDPGAARRRGIPRRRLPRGAAGRRHPGPGGRAAEPAGAGTRARAAAPLRAPLRAVQGSRVRVTVRLEPRSRAGQGCARDTTVSG